MIIYFTLGHVDIYMNGGMMQPKCTWPSMEIAGLKDISDLAAISMDGKNNYLPLIKCDWLKEKRENIYIRNYRELEFEDYLF